jgi:DNA-binding PadR family transcriptional regulator
MHSHAISGRWGDPSGASGHFDPRALWFAMSGHRGGHRGRHGRGPRGGPHFGPGPFGPGFGRGPRARRGDVRAALLVLLAEEPRNGYGLMQEIERRSGGAWRPSPGSVYPALQQLEDEGLVRPVESAGRKEFELTDEGRAYVTDNADELGTPWEDVAGGNEHVAELRTLVFGVGAAVMQVVQAGTEAQVAEASRVLEDTRRALYRILAGDEPAGGDDDAPADGGDAPTAA